MSISYEFANDGTVTLVLRRIPHLHTLCALSTPSRRYLVRLEALLTQPAITLPKLKMLAHLRFSSALEWFCLLVPSLEERSEDLTVLGIGRKAERQGIHQKAVSEEQKTSAGRRPTPVHD